MATQISEIRRRYFPSTGMFVFYQDGKEIAKKWRDGRGEMKVEGMIPDAVIRTYFEDEKGNETDKLFAEWNYRKGKLDGKSKIYDESGQLVEVLEYQDGKLDEIVKKHYEEGHLCFESTLHNSNGQVTFKEF